MSTKMKGLFKGLRYISQIFGDYLFPLSDEDQQKEQDMQIGLPTDVKHVAHVGWDGPGSANSTSVDSPNWMKDLGPSTATGKDNAEDKWVSEDSTRAQRKKKSQEKEQQQQGEGSKPSRRKSADNNPIDTSSKPRQSRRTHAKDSSDAQPSQDPDAPKKTRRKKSEAGDQAGSRRPKNRSAANCVDSDPGPSVQKLNSDDDEREGRLNS